MNIKKITYLKQAIVISLILLNACASNKYVTNAKDPFEPYNRSMYRFNKTADCLYIRPVSKTYELIIPKALRNLIHNFFVNLSEVPTVINSLLQAKCHQAVDSTARFVINSTLGIGGLFDVASKANLKRTPEDFGKTLAAWGYKDSSYLILPIIGPSTVRDSIGAVGNAFMTIPEYLKPKWRNRYYFSYAIDRRSDVQEAELFISNLGIDDYKSMRDSYLQNRDYAINKQSNKTLLTEPPE